jgi:hypothetical protein
MLLLLLPQGRQCSNAGKIYVRNDMLFFTMVPVGVLFFATSCIIR